MEVSSLQGAQSIIKQELARAKDPTVPRCFQLPLSLSGQTLVDFEQLMGLVSTSADVRTHGEWDKKMEIHCVHVSLDAVRGYWSRMGWPWMAWKKNSTEWQVVVGRDGFYCDEVEKIPEQYRDFFYDTTYFLDGSVDCRSRNLNSDVE
jgi:hypothetical protein